MTNEAVGDALRDAALNNAILYNAFMLKAGGMPWVDVLERAALALAKQNDGLVRDLAEASARRCSHSVYPASEDLF